MTRWLCRNYTRGELDRTRPLRETARCEAELRAGNPDVIGALLGLHDWSAESALMDAEAHDKSGRICLDDGEIYEKMDGRRRNALASDAPPNQTAC